MARSVMIPRPVVVFALGLLAVAIAALAAYTWTRSRQPGLLEQARAAYARGDWRETAVLADRRLKETPDDLEALRWVARGTARQDHDQAALQMFSRAGKALDPDDRYLCARAMARLGDRPAAIRVLESALEREPEHADSLDLLCRLYYQADRYYASAAMAERLARHPDREAKAMLMLAIARNELEDPAGVAQALERWRTLDPDGREALPDPPRKSRLMLVRAWLETGRAKDAVTLLESLPAFQSDAEISWLLSRAWLQQRDLPRATEALKTGKAFREQSLEPEPAPRVGQARCTPCHREQAQAVLASRHARTFRRGRDLKGPAIPTTPITDPGDPRVSHQFERDGDTLRLTTTVGTQALRAVIDYAFGSADHFSTLVGRDDHGHDRMIRISVYGKKEGYGWDLATAVPPHPENPEDFLGTSIDDRDGPRRCLFCHTTSFRAIQDETGPAALDQSIGCEKCHGPGGNHLLAVEAGFPDMAILNPRPETPAAANASCAQCHAFPSAELQATPRTDPGLYRFQSVALTWSRCYTETAGALSCVTCHDPHRDVETSTAANEAKCLACHGQTAAAAPGKPRAQASAAGRGSVCRVNPRSGCLSCHMPTTWQQDSHTMKTDHYIRVREPEPAAKPAASDRVKRSGA